MWTQKDIIDGVDYRVWLCNEDGYRRVRVSQDGVIPPGGVLCTPVVSSEMLRFCDVYEVSERVELVGGMAFVVNAHGSWYTKDEYEALRSGMDFSAIPWVTGEAPRLAPK